MSSRAPVRPSRCAHIQVPRGVSPLLTGWGVRAILLLSLGWGTGTVVAADKVASPKSPAPTVAATKPQPFGSLIGYQSADGAGYLALSLQAESLPSAASPVHHVILVDTSASQAGGHRRQALLVLEGFLAALPKTDRVQLMCVDVEVQSMTAGFATCGSKDLKDGMARLRKRVPLGASNLQPGLQAALAAFTGPQRGSILYLGDGMSTAQLIQPTTLKPLISSLRERKIAFHSYAVGPRTDLQLLGVMAEHTGGVLLADALIDETHRPAYGIGRDLAAAAVAPVFYAKRIALQPEFTSLLPWEVPPFRADRATVMLGKGTLPKSLKVTAESADGKKLAWQIKPVRETAGNAFLAPLWEMAVPDQGLKVPLAGTEYLNLARQTFDDQVTDLVALGRQAISARDVRRAEDIAWTIRQADPQNMDARTILNASQTIKLVKHALDDKRLALLQDSDEPVEETPAGEAEEMEAAEESEAEEAPADEGAEEAAGEDSGDAAIEASEEMPAEDEATAEEEATEAPAADAGESEEPTNTPAEPSRRGTKIDDTEEAAEIEETAQNRRDLLAEERERMHLRAEALKREVSASVQAAQGISREDPDTALGELKRTQNTVEAALDIDVNVREQLRARLRKVQNEIASRREVLEQIKIRHMEREAQVRAQKNLVDQIVQRDQKLEQLIDRVRSLLTEGYLGNADAFEEGEAVARAAWELAPYSGTTVAAIFDAEAAGQLDKAMRLRSMRADKFLEVLHQVELSHVPFPDEPPILWPPAEVWKALTERRRKWASVDLVRYNPIEERIRKSLDAPTDVEFIETPLKDALLFLKDQHNINIWLDEAKISDEGVATDQPVNLQLSGITLRSVLKLLLEPLQLTYVIDDEVMKITTTVAAGEKLYTRVYPVGDLVIPISQGQAGGLGQGLGGVGGLGGSGGQMGRGQFGVGGGVGGNGMGGGGGGMGMGGGMFNVR